MITSPGLAELVERHLGWSGYSPGCSVVVQACTGADVAQYAAGRASPHVAMAATTPFNVWCGLKPVVACAVARLLEVEGIGYDVPVGDYCELWSRRAGSPTFHQLVSHTAGLARPLSWELRIAAPATRSELVDAAVRAWPGPELQYSELMMPYTLGQIVRDVTGLNPSRWLSGQLASAAIGGIWFGLAGWTPARARAEIGLYHELREEPGACLPLAHDVLPSFLSETTFGLANVASPAGLASWYASLGAHITTGIAGPLFPGPDAWNELVKHGREPVVDAHMQRELGFTCGMVSNIAAELGLARWDGDLLGHWGWTGASIGLVDPGRRVAVTLQVNGLVDGRLEYVERRATFLDALVEALDAG